MGSVADQLHHDWLEFAAPEAAVTASKAFARLILSGELDPITHLSDLEVAVEPMWDGPSGDPRLALETAIKTEIAFRNAETFLTVSSEERIEFRLRPQALLTECWHRLPNPRQAFVSSLKALRWLEEFVGGQDALADIITRPAKTPAAGMAVSILAGFPAPLRRLGGRAAGQFLDHGLRLVIAYLRLDRDGPVLYPRTWALASQWFYASVGSGDETVVRALYELDVRARPTHARARATVPLRDLEFARRFGSPADVEQYRLAAIRSLHRSPLPRHKSVISGEGYLAA